MRRGKYLPSCSTTCQTQKAWIGTGAALVLPLGHPGSFLLQGWNGVTAPELGDGGEEVHGDGGMQQFCLHGLCKL